MGAELSDTPAGLLRKRTWPTSLLYLLIATPICFLGLSATDAITMEGIIADGARHMARTQEYAVPHLHGEIYSYKPPLAYWMSLASFQLFSEETERSLRFPFALSGLLMGLGVMLLTRRVAGSRAALLCALASLTGILMLQKLRLAEWDLPLAAAVGVAAAVACRQFAGAPSHGGLWLLGYLALAVAFLIKGVPALMFYAPGLLLAAWLTGCLKQLFRPAHLIGAALFVVLVGWWIASAYQAAGWAAFEQPLAEARDKGLTWDASTVGMSLLKPLLAAVFFLPWTLLLPASFRSEAWSAPPVRRMALAAAAFVAAGVLVFMAVPADDSRYLLPLAAPMGILCGLAAKDVLARAGARRHAIQILTLLVALGAIATAIQGESGGFASRGALLLLAALALATVAYGLIRKVELPAVALLATIAILAWLAQTWVVGPHRASSRSLRAMAESFEARMSPEAELWTAPVSKHWRHSSLFFYLQRPVRTMSADGSGPADGDFVVLISDEHEELMANVPFSHDVIDRQQQRRYDYMLLRKRGD